MSGDVPFCRLLEFVGVYNQSRFRETGGAEMSALRRMLDELDGVKAGTG